MKKANMKKIRIIVTVISVFCIIYNLLYLISTTLFEKKCLQIFGISFLCMPDNLMENDMSQNDLVVIKKVNKKELQKNEIIAYEVNDTVRINKIINIGEKIATKSNKAYYPNLEKITTEQIIGKKILNIPFLGNVLKILESRILSLLIFIVLVARFTYNRNILKKAIVRAKKKEKFELLKEKSDGHKKIT